MQNWNDGKAQEFKDRKVYNIGASVLTHTGPMMQDCCGAEPTVDFFAEEAAAEKKAPTVILYATETCPNCKLAASWLEKAGIPFEKRFVSEHEEEAKALGLKQAPSLVVDGEAGTEIFVGVANIKQFINQQ